MTCTADPTKNPNNIGDDRAHALTKVLRSAPDPIDPNAVRQYLADLAEAALHVLFVQPGSKRPADPRTSREANAANRTARKQAEAAGRANWRKVTAPAGHALATADLEVLDRYLDQYCTDYPGQPVNLGVKLGPSRLVVVDCDTSDQVSAFLADAEAPADLSPTVASPGMRDERGNWPHRDGGHFWFVVPEHVELPTTIGTFTAAGGYAVMWGECYVLIPPSTRAEGAYTAPGEVHVLPEWLCEQIVARGRDLRDRATRCGADEDSTSITAWSQSQTWAEILGPNWTPTGRADSCGCETWTAPGEHGSPKSATAHEIGCTIAQHDPGNPPLHFWTTGDRGQFSDWPHDNISKLQAVALSEYDNDMGDAMTALDLFDDGETVMLDDRAETPEQVDARFEQDVRKREAYLLADREARKRIAAVDAATLELPPVMGLADLLDEPDDPVRFRIEGVWPSGGAKILCAAAAKSGKTTLSGNLVRALADGDPFLGAFAVNQTAQRIVVIDNEMTRGMLRRWLRRQGIHNTAAVADVVNLRGKTGLFDMGNDRVREMWSRRLRDLGCDFVIFDCLKPALEAMGLDENRETGKFLYPFSEMLADAGVQDVLVHHHMGHNNERARGDSTLMGWTDGNWKIVRDMDDPATPRYFSAPDVRDAEEPVGEGLLSFEPATGRLTYEGGNRTQTRENNAVEKTANAVLDVLAEAYADPDKPNAMTTTDIKKAVTGKNSTIADALTLLRDEPAERSRLTVTNKGRAYFYEIKPSALDPMYLGDGVALAE